MLVNYNYVLHVHVLGELSLTISAIPVHSLKYPPNRLGCAYVDVITQLTRGRCNENMSFIQSFHLIYIATVLTVHEFGK